jgi:hypothetical protein
MAGLPQTPAQIILSVSTSLNDQEPGFTFVRWPQLELLGYLNEGSIEVGNYRPDAFTSTANLTLSAGSQQTISGVGILLKSIDSNGASSLCPAAPITQVDLQLLRSFYKKPCLPTGGPLEYRVLSYAYDAKNPLTFYVSPPVPAGNTAQVVATIVRAADQYDNTTINSNLLIDQKYYNALKFWMLARAYEVDTESNTSQMESEKFYKKFYNLLGVQYKQASDYNGGRFLGQGSNHNMVKDRVV